MRKSLYNTSTLRRIFPTHWLNRLLCAYWFSYLKLRASAALLLSYSCQVSLTCWNSRPTAAFRDVLGRYPLNWWCHTLTKKQELPYKVCAAASDQSKPISKTANWQESITPCNISKCHLRSWEKCQIAHRHALIDWPSKRSICSDQEATQNIFLRLCSDVFVSFFFFFKPKRRIDKSPFQVKLGLWRAGGLLPTVPRWFAGLFYLDYDFMFYSFAYFCYLVLIRRGIAGAAFRTVTSQLERSWGRSLGGGAFCLEFTWSGYACVGSLQGFVWVSSL